MTIPFNTVPNNIRVPLFYAEFDNSGAVQGPTLLAYVALILGTMLAAGTATPLTPVRVTAPEQGPGLFGAGSELAGMLTAWFKSNTFTELYVIPMLEDGAGVQATGKVIITGTATGAGSINPYVGGNDVKVPVAIGDDATTMGGNLESLVNADTSLPVTASNAAGVVTITAKTKGEGGNDIDLRLNYFGEETAAGVTVVIEDMGTGTAGANNPDITGAIAAMGDEWYQIITMPYTDTANLALLEAELTDRFGAIRMIDGVAFASVRDSLAGASALGNSRNSPHVSIQYAGSEPRPSYEVAAETAAIAARYGQNDPARPFQTLPYVHRLAPAEADRPTIQERNILLFDGISTNYIGSDGTVRVERLIATYKENALGAPDTSYLDVNTMLTLQYIRFDWRAYITSKYPRHKLADDGQRLGAGQPVMTPSLAKAEAVNKFRQWEELGLVENVEQFKNDLIAERNISDPNRLDILMPPDLVNQLRVFATLIRFLL